MKKISNKILVLTVTLLVAIASIVKVNAAPETIQLGNPGKTGAYIAGVNFSYKTTTDGQDLFCLDMNRNTAKNITAKLVKDSKYINGGLLYILKNGYPEKSITGDKDKDYYITQTAVWWYLDSTTGSKNLGSSFKETGSDDYGLRKYVKQLVDEGIAHKNDSIEVKTPKLELSSSKSLTLKDSYYESDAIKASVAENITSYTVTLENAPKGTMIEKNGQSSEYSGAFSVSKDESFKVKVPTSSVEGTDISMKVSATAKGETSYAAYEYQPTDSKMQNVALLEKTNKEVKTSFDLELSTTKVTIIKLDSVTKEPIAGAVLVLKNEAGEEITRWTSTTNAHVIKNLANGTYTIEEVEAPIGYALNKNVSKFTITDTNRNIKINFENAPKNVVINIIKVDEETNEPLAGATLVIRDESGEIVYKYVTTTEPEVITDLENGTYTVEEIEAPAGYVKSDRVVKFTIDDEHQSHQITFKNTKEVDVPDTATVSPLLIMILGIVITGVGIRFVYKNGKAVR